MKQLISHGIIFIYHVINIDCILKENNFDTSETDWSNIFDCSPSYNEVNSTKHKSRAFLLFLPKQGVLFILFSSSTKNSMQHTRKHTKAWEHISLIDHNSLDDLDVIQTAPFSRNMHHL